jgi:selenocysteine lyase/cysteine desulfurase
MTAVLPARAPIASTTAAPALPATAGADLQVPLVTGERVRYANLDLAASAPALCAVAEHVTELLPYSASVHRGAGYASRVCTAVLEQARSTIAGFLGARADDVVVFTRNTTDALNLLAGCVPGSVLTLDVEHHANLLPWRRGRHRVLPAGPTLADTLADLEDALAAEPTALVAVTGASNVTGEALPLTRIAGLAHAAGARLLVDAAQLAPHRRIDLAATGIDYLALSGHKLYAPFGSGVLVGRRDWLDAGEPYLAGGGATRRVRTGTDPGAGGTDTVEFEPLEVQWATAPERHEGGTPNVVGAAALAAACRALDPALDDALPAHERTLLDRLVDALDEIPGVDRLRIWPDCPDRVGVVSFGVDPYPAGLVAAYLSAEHGIGVRDGRFCAHPLVDRLTSEPEGAVRASLGVGTTVEDVDRLAAALTTLVSRGPGWTYAVIDGRWTPAPDPRGALNPLLPDPPAPAGAPTPCANGTLAQ